MNLIKSCCLFVVFSSFLACTPQVSDVKSMSYTEFVNPFIGTDFTGNTYPGAQAPFGMVQLSPDNGLPGWDRISGYFYPDSTIAGFSHTHLSGTGAGDLYDISFMPVTLPYKEAEAPLGIHSLFSHSEESASAGYYQVRLKDYNINVELTATERCGIQRYTFPKADAAVFLNLRKAMNWDFTNDSHIEVVDSVTVQGYRYSDGWARDQRLYFRTRFSKPFVVMQLDTAAIEKDGKRIGTSVIARFDFQTKEGEQILVSTAISGVSMEGAARNLAAEVPDDDFDKYLAAVQDDWNKQLSRIEIKCDDRDEKVKFYTALYHSMVVPNVVSDVNGEYRRHDMTTGRMPEGRKHYSTFSLWDTFRAWNPLMTLLDAGLVNDMVNSFLDIYDASGELPIWPLSAGETGTMIGYHSASVIADAYLKGIRGFDAEKALEAMVASAEKNEKGADCYVRNGFIPSNIKRESISCLLEFAYDDWCIARMAQEMEKEDICKTFIARSQNYVNVFDGATKFFRPKRMDGNWEAPFKPLEVGRAYTEATAWQYRFFVPHDVNGMMQLFGGKDDFVVALDSIFSSDLKLEGELSDITGLIGQYVHGNEPSHHIAYLYDYVGQPWKTQELTRRLLREMYAPTPEGIIGNEDCGQMSAWYILSSLGFYSVCPGSNEFALTTPLFDKAVIRLANGKTLSVLANNPEKNIYINKVELNGEAIEGNFITYEQLMEGGELRFTLTDKPDKSRGVSEESALYSYTKEHVVSVPYVDKDLNLFMDKITVALATVTAGAEVRYTLDGSEPTELSPLYEKPLELDQTTPIKAKGFKDGFCPSHTLSIMATKAEMKPALAVCPVRNGTSYKYFEGTYRKVADIEKSPLLDIGIMAEPSIKEARQEDHFGYIFSGLIEVPEDGIYTFMTRSDDGSVLYIDDEMVVNNDGSHAAIPATGTVALKKGFHAYKLYYFEDYEGEELGWGWKLPSAQELSPIPASALYVK